MSLYALAFVIDALPELPNKLRHAHWRIVQRHDHEWQQRIRVAVGRDAPPGGPLPFARVKMVRHSSHQPDLDNLVASWKSCVDGLVRAQVIFDDAPRFIDFDGTGWEKAKRGAGHIGVSVLEVER